MKGRVLGLQIVGTAALLALAPSLAWSYIDPGNGAYMVQVLFTLIGAALFYIRHPIRFFHAWRDWIFRRHSSEIEPVDELEAAPLDRSAEKAGGRTD